MAAADLVPQGLQRFGYQADPGSCRVILSDGTAVSELTETTMARMWVNFVFPTRTEVWSDDELVAEAPGFFNIEQMFTGVGEVIDCALATRGGTC